MALTFEQIITTYYADEFQQGLFGLAYNNSGEIVIDFWNVPNVPEPTRQEIMDLGTPELEFQYNLKQFFLQFAPFIQNYIDSIAIQRGYGNSLYCLSYINSSNTKWLNDATAFNAWRDAVWSYIDSQQVLIENGTRPIPTDMNDLIGELPVISWP